MTPGDSAEVAEGSVVLVWTPGGYCWLTAPSWLPMIGRFPAAEAVEAA